MQSSENGIGRFGKLHALLVGSSGVDRENVVAAGVGSRDSSAGIL